MREAVCRRAIVVRAITVEDWRLWRELRLAALAEAPHAFGATLADWQGVGDHPARWRARLNGVALNLVAEVEGQAVGMASGTRPDAGEVELLSFWVAPWARGKGVSERLIARLAEWAQRQGAAALVLKVYVHNERAITMYRRNGFVSTEVVSARCAPREDEWRMVRALRST